MNESKKAEALKRLKALVSQDAESAHFDAHFEADGVLLDLIDDEEIRGAYADVPKW